MAGPWEKYGAAQQPTGPWAKYQSAAQTVPWWEKPAGDDPAPQWTGAEKEFADFASGATQNPAKAQYDALPGWQKPIVAASDAVQLFGTGATFGFGDKAVAGARSLLGDKSYEDELAEQRRLTEGARRRSGSAGLATELTGAVATPLAIAKKGLTLAGLGGTAGMTGLKGLGVRSALMGAEGAGYGALTAKGNDQDIGTGAMLGAAGGFGGNIVGEGISAGLDKIAGLFNKAPVRNTAAKLNAGKDAAYALSEKAGVIIKPQGLQKLHQKVVDEFTEFGFDPALQPRAAAVLARIEKDIGNNVTLKGLDTIRKVASNAYDPMNKSNNALVSKVIKRIDQLIDSNDPNLMAGIDTAIGTKALKVAREFAHRARKLETVENLIVRGQRRGASNKSQNVEQATKRQIVSLLNKGARGFNPAEKAAAERALGYGRGERLLDAASGALPLGRLSGLAHMSLGGANLATGNVLGLAAQGGSMVVGYAAKKAAESLAAKSVNEFVDLVARGGVPAPVVKNALQLLAKSKRDAVSRALMAVMVNRGSRAQTPAQ